MSLVTTPYFNLECDGPARTLLQDHCTTTSKGGWNKEEVLEDAEARGWSVSGRNKLCPEHAADAAPPAESPAPVRKSRTRGKDTPTVSEDHSGADENTWQEAQAS
jgi:hypothetical protein